MHSIEQLQIASTKSQHPSKQQKQKNNNEIFQPSIILKALCFYLYFLQGIILSLGSTMPYIYKQLPPYDIMSIFAASIMPFSLKFLTAPFIEKYTSIKYGKRKTWIILSQLITSFFLYLSSFHTGIEDSIHLGIYFIIITFFISLQDIALDGLAIKQLKVPHIASSVQAIGQTLGVVSGSILLLKLTSLQFAQGLSLQQQISSPQTLFKVIALLIIVPTGLIHFLFQETTLQSQKQIAKKSFFQVISYYKVFIKINSKLCRTVFMFLVMFQGINFFNAGYDYELIKAGFSRNVSNTISNVTVLPISILACVLSSQIQKYGVVNSLRLNMILTILLATYLVIFFPLDIWKVSIASFLGDFLGTWQFLICSIVITGFPINGVVGMYLTMLASMSNFGKLKALHTYFLSLFGWRFCTFVGLIIQFLIVIFIKDIYIWTSKGNDFKDYFELQVQQSQKCRLDQEQLQQIDNKVYSNSTSPEKRKSLSQNQQTYQNFTRHKSQNI